MNLEEAMKAKADAESAKADVENLLQVKRHITCTIHHVSSAQGSRQSA